MLELKSVGVVLADEKATVLGATMRARVIAARRERERHAPENQDFECGVEVLRLVTERTDRRGGHFCGKAEVARAAACEQRNTTLVVDVHKRTDVVRSPCQLQQRGSIVGFDETFRRRTDALHEFAVEIARYLGERGGHDRFPRGAQSFGHRLVMRRKQWGAFRANDFTEIDGRHRRFVGDAEIEVPPLIGRPIEQNRPQGDFSRTITHRYLHVLLR